VTQLTKKDRAILRKNWGVSNFPPEGKPTTFEEGVKTKGKKKVDWHSAAVDRKEICRGVIGKGTLGMSGERGSDIVCRLLKDDVSPSRPSEKGRRNKGNTALRKNLYGREVSSERGGSEGCGKFTEWENWVWNFLGGGGIRSVKRGRRASGWEE